MGKDSPNRTNKGRGSGKRSLDQALLAKLKAGLPGGRITLSIDLSDIQPFQATLPAQKGDQFLKALQAILDALPAEARQSLVEHAAASPNLAIGGPIISMAIGGPIITMSISAPVASSPGAPAAPDPLAAIGGPIIPGGPNRPTA